MAFVEFRRGSHVDPDSVLLVDVDEQVQPYEIKVHLIGGGEKTCGKYSTLAAARRQARNIALALNYVKIAFEPDASDGDKVIKFPK